MLNFISLWEVDLNEYQFTKEDLAASMHAIRISDNKVYVGSKAIDQILIRIPALMPLGLLFFLLDKCMLGNPLYSLLAKNRYIIPIGKCTLDQCNNVAFSGSENVAKK
ncbi:Protein of unknown function, DUF393 [Alicyclobacillus tolerans]|uniref:Uncharacterized protein n=2 Tax=Alicyclobacillus tolerans TaxID=90970 RepID=A0A1M6Y7M8_9BACL|nr:Protein of unknown function, DUF393 [Alicyclobacillus montanus]